MKIKIILFLVVSNILFSQNNLDDLIKYYAKFNSYSMSFEIVNNKNNILNKGKIFFSKNKFKILMDDLLLIYDGIKYYTIIEENQEINVSKENEITKLIVPTNIISLIKNNIENIKLIQNSEYLEFDYKHDFRSNYIIQFSNDNKISTIKHLVNEKLYNEIVFTDINFDLEIEKKNFEFNQDDYPGYYLNKLWK